MGTNKVTRMKAIELMLDWNLWPRYEAQELDWTNLNRIKEAMKNGEVFPPVIASADDYRVVDGFHRTTAALAVFGDGAEIDVVLKSYENEGAMFLESVRMNAIHGLPLSPRDRAHAVLKARRFKIPMPVIAATLGSNEEDLKAFMAKRTAVVRETGEKVVLSAGARNLAGCELDPDQEHFVRTTNGCIPEMHARLLLNALKARGSFELTDATVKLLKSVRDHINALLRGVK